MIRTERDRQTERKGGGEKRRAGEDEHLGDTGKQVSGCNIKVVVEVNSECHTNIIVARQRGSDAVQKKTSQQLIISRQMSLALKYLRAV